jgi:hypothetical protein
MTIGMVRPTGGFRFEWDDDLDARPLAEDRKTDIAWLYHRASAPLYGKPDGGDLGECLRDVDGACSLRRSLRPGTFKACRARW